MLVQDFLEAAAARLPDKVALICGDRRLTYSEVDAMADRLAAALLEMGVRRGDRVVIHLNNSVDCVIGIFAALKADAVFVVINFTTKRDKLVYILNNCNAAVLLADARADAQGTVGRLQKAVPSLLGIILCGEGADLAARRHTRCQDFAAIQERLPAVRPARSNIDLDLACLIYTSGSTGDPKGVMCDHGNIVFAAGAIIEYIRNVESDVVINVLPLSFDYGLYQLLMAFKLGGTLVLENSFAFPAAILKVMEKERVTGFPGVPTIFAMLLRQDLSNYDLSSLRYITNTAAALPTSHILEVRRKFPRARLYSMYGLTETKRTLYLPPEELDRRPGSVGIAIPGTEVWLEDETGSRPGPDQPGELVVRGRHVMRGYWGSPEATAERFRPGRIPGERVCHTGDIFRMDAEGFFYFIGRKDDIIKSRGEKVSPREVENVLCTLEGVAEAAVVGVSDPLLGQAVKAFVVLAEGANLSETQVLAHCRAHLEDFMIPKIVEFRTALPKTSSGKIRKASLI